LQHITGKLVIIPISDPILIAIPILEGGYRFDPVVSFGQHLRHKNIRIGVIVHVCQVSSHRSSADALHLIRKALVKGTIVVVDIEVVALKEIVGHIDILPAVFVDVAHRHTETKSNNTTVNTRLLTDISKTISVIAE
jgi:hypothetical protein